MAQGSKPSGPLGPIRPEEVDRKGHAVAKGVESSFEDGSPEHRVKWGSVHNGKIMKGAKKG